MLDIINMSHRDYIDTHKAEERAAFLLRWKELGRQRLSYAKKFIFSKHGPKPLSSKVVAARGMV